jgi:hypothetical protein
MDVYAHAAGVYDRARELQWNRQHLLPCREGMEEIEELLGLYSVLYPKGMYCGMDHGYPSFLHNLLVTCDGVASTSA